MGKRRILHCAKREERHEKENDADKIIGRFSGIPMVKKDALWRFDTKEGSEEILARRIGRNQLDAIQVCLAYVDAQREYALKDRDADGLLRYAQKFRSDKGLKNGLYWELKEGEEQSPLGLLVAAAQEEGYNAKSTGNKPVPYHGYYYRILKGQGNEAPDGAYDYLVKGEMIGGFALVAHPAKYGSTKVRRRPAADRGWLLSWHGAGATVSNIKGGETCGQMPDKVIDTV